MSLSFAFMETTITQSSNATKVHIYQRIEKTPSFLRRVIFSCMCIDDSRTVKHPFAFGDGSHLQLFRNSYYSFPKDMKIVIFCLVYIACFALRQSTMAIIASANNHVSFSLDSKIENMYTNQVKPFYDAILDNTADSSSSARAFHEVFESFSKARYLPKSLFTDEELHADVTQCSAKRSVSLHYPLQGLHTLSHKFYHLSIALHGEYSIRIDSLDSCIQMGDSSYVVQTWRIYLLQQILKIHNIISLNDMKYLPNMYLQRYSALQDYSSANIREVDFQLHIKLGSREIDFINSNCKVLQILGHEIDSEICFHYVDWKDEILNKVEHHRNTTETITDIENVPCSQETVEEEDLKVEMFIAATEAIATISSFAVDDNLIEKMEVVVSEAIIAGHSS